MRYCILLSILFSLRCFAQQNDTTKKSVAGHITDATDSSSLAFVTVFLIKNDTLVVKAVLSDSAGAYSIDGVDQGTYKLLFTFVGYDSLTTNLFEITESNTPVRKNAVMRRGKELLVGVKVVSRRSVIEQQVDGFTFHVAATNQVAGGTGLDALKTVPLVMVGSGGTIRVLGKRNVRIFVDDKPIDLYGSSPAEYLAQIPADKIERVRLVTNPSARYDAEGADAIIHIYTKKNLLQHVGGMARIMLGNRNTHTFSSLFFYRKNKWNISFNSTLHIFRWYRYNTIARNGKAQGNEINFHQLLTDTIKADNPSIYTNVDLSLDSTSSLNATFTYTRYNYKARSLTDNDFTSAPASRDIKRRAIEKNRYHYYTYVLAYSKRFKKERQEISVAGIVNTRNFFDGYDANQITNASDLYLERFDNRTLNTEFSIQADYTHPVTKTIVLEGGIKTMFRRASSRYQVESFQTIGMKYVVDTTRSGNFSYEQKLNAGYISVESRFGKWTIRTGLRFEKTSLDAIFKDTALAILPYTNWVPNFTLTKTLNNDGSLRFSYTQRIQRPYVSLLNPAVSYRDSFTISKGNPTLLPQVLHAAEISFSQSPPKIGFVWVAANASYTNNSFQQTMEMLDNGVSVLTWRNIAAYHSVGIAGGWSKTIKEKLTMNIGGSISFQEFEVPSTGLYNKGWAIEASSSITYKFNKRTAIQGSISYQNKAVELQGYTTYAVPSAYDILISRQIWKERAGVYCRVENFITEYQYRNGRYEDRDIIQTSRLGFAARVIQLGFHYRFNQKIAESRTRARVISQQTRTD